MLNTLDQQVDLGLTVYSFQVPYVVSVEREYSRLTKAKNSGKTI